LDRRELDGRVVLDLEAGAMLRLGCPRRGELDRVLVDRDGRGTGGAELHGVRQVQRPEQLDPVIAAAEVDGLRVAGTEQGVERGLEGRRGDTADGGRRAEAERERAG